MEGKNRQFRIGTMLRRLRREEKITLARLCQGLCSRAELERIEEGVRLPNYFLMKRLFSRMGKSSNRLEYIVSPQEYLLYEWRLRIQTAFLRGEYRQADSLLERFAEAEGFKKPLHRQFYYSMKACLFRKQNRQSLADEALKKAILETVPTERLEEALQKFLLGVEELQLFVLRQFWKDNNGGQGGAFPHITIHRSAYYR